MFADALAVLEAGSSSRRLRDPLGVKEQQVGWRQWQLVVVVGRSRWLGRAGLERSWGLTDC